MQSQGEILSIANSLRSSPGKLTFFLGAGMSIAAGIPSANAIVARLKEHLYRAHFDIRPEDTVDPSAPGTWFYKNYTLSTTDSAYSQILDLAFPSAFERRQFFESLVDGCEPTQGHQDLARTEAEAMRSRGRVPLIITTNFDRLTEYALLDAFGDFPYVCYHLRDVTTFPLDGRHPSIVKLHGDYLFEDIANLGDELDLRMRGTAKKKLMEAVSGQELVVVGYSGNDRSIMEALQEFNEQGIVERIYWVRRMGDPVSAGVEALSKSPKGNVAIIDYRDADSFFRDLYGLAYQTTPDPTPMDGGQNRVGFSIPGLRLPDLRLAIKTNETSPKTMQSFLQADEMAQIALEHPEVLHLIWGPTGSGKTQFLQLLAASLRDHYHVSLSVQSMAQRTLPGWQSEVVRLDAGSWAAPPSNCQALLVDGLDGSREGAVIDSLVSWKVAHPDIPVFVTVTGKPGLPEAQPVRSYVMQTLDDEQIIQYAKTRAALNFATFTYCWEQLECQFVDLFRRPLYLQMLICIVEHFDRSVVPTRGELVHRLCTGYIIDWHLGSRMNTKFKARSILTALAAIAGYEISQGQSIPGGSRNVPSSAPAIDAEILEELIRAGFVAEHNAHLRFGSALFRDYFGARYLYERVGFKTPEFEELLANPKWHNSWILFSCLVSDPSELVEQLLSSGSRYHTFLAARTALEGRNLETRHLLNILDHLCTRFEQDIRERSHNLVLPMGKDSIVYLVQLLNSPILSAEQQQVLYDRLDRIIHGSRSDIQSHYVHALSAAYAESRRSANE